MASEKRCPRCGSELPLGSLEGLCPKCLMAVGLESGAATIESPMRGSGAATSPDSSRFVPPEPASLAAHFPHLEILELLGHGGMGAVYKARQKNLDRLVALKIIRPEAADTPAFTERFNREARMLARLNHPHIVAIYDFGEVSVSDPGGGSRPPRSLYFFLMEYVDGSSLRQQMRSGELTPQQALKVVPQICDALQYAHDEGIVHRDIKPENILLDKRGRVKIADFGLAKLAAGSANDYTLTATHHVLGTVRYMAPEQMEGSHAVDHRADIYSLGVVFYEMLTREVPAGHFEPPSKKVQVDVRLDEVVLRALAREPERRYQHASDVKDEVESICKLMPAEKTSAESGEAKLILQRLIGPAVGMLAIGTALTLWLALAVFSRLPSGFEDWWVIGLGGPLLLLGGFAMKGGRAYWLALAASLTCLAIGFATLYFVFIAPFVPLAALFVGGYSLWRLMQPEVQEAFRQQQQRSGISFGRRRLVITVSVILPILAVVCAAPLFIASYRQQLALRDAKTHVEHQPTASPAGRLPPPANRAPDVDIEEGPDPPSPPQPNGTVAQRSRDGSETVVRMANEGDVVNPTLSGKLIEYEPYVYKSQSIRLSGDRPQRLSFVFILDCSQSMNVTSKTQAGRLRMDLAKDSFHFMLSEIAKRNDEGDDTRVGVRFFGHRVGWSPNFTWTPNGNFNDIPPLLNPSQDVELVQPLGVFGNEQIAKVLKHLDLVKGWGETPLYFSLMEALDDFDRDDANTRKSIIVISDGKDDVTLRSNGGPAPRRVTLEMLLENWQRRNTKIPIHILGFEMDAAQLAAARRDFLRIATETKGSFRQVRAGSDLRNYVREHFGVAGYFVSDGEGLYATASGALEPARLNSAVAISNAYQIPGVFHVSFPGVPPKKVLIEGGEALELHLKKQGEAHDIVAETYNKPTLASEYLVNGEGGPPSNYLLRVHWPIYRGDAVEFPISLQQDTQQSHFTRRPAETWLEITPISDDGFGQVDQHPPYVFYDTNFAPDEPVPVLTCPAINWRDWTKARIKFWCKYRPTEPVIRIGLRDATYRTPQNVPNLNGVQVRVEPSESGGVYRVYVTEKHSAESPGVSDALRIQVQSDPRFKPTRVRRQFDNEAGLATHLFEFPASDRKAIEEYDGSQIVVTRASDIKDGALQVSDESELEVAVGREDMGALHQADTVGSQSNVESGREMFHISVNALDGLWRERVDSVVLHPLPNRMNHFGFNLANLTNLKKTVTVSFIAPDRIPPDDRLVLPRGPMKQSAADALLSQFGGKELTWPQAVELPASGEPVRIKFTSSADQEPPVQPNLLISNPAAPDKPPGTDLPYGLIIVIEDVEANRITLRRVKIEPQRPRDYLSAIAQYGSAGELKIEVTATNKFVVPAEGINISANIDGISPELANQLTAILRAPTYSTTLYGKVHPDAPSELTATIDVDGYPRAFTFRIRRGTASSGIEPIRDAMGVRIVSPERKQAFKAPGAIVPVALEVDAPEGAFYDGSAAHIAVGIDSDRDRELTDEIDLPLIVRSDRQVSVAAKSFSPDGTLTLQTTVSDFRLDLQSAHRNLTAWLLARLSAPPLEISSDPVEILLDGAGPDIEKIQLTDSAIEADTDAEVVVFARDLSRIVKVEATFETVTGPNSDNEIHPWTPAQTDDGVRWIAKLKTAGLLPGTRQYVLVRATDVVGHETIERSNGIRIVAENATKSSSSNLDEGPLE